MQVLLFMAQLIIKYLFLSYGLTTNTKKCPYNKEGRDFGEGSLSLAIKKGRVSHKSIMMFLKKVVYLSLNFNKIS
jgi:hypothetical protein